MAEPFPRNRFALADATEAEIDQLEHEYERSDLGLQIDSIEHYQSQSTGGLRDYLENLRETGHFSDAPETGPDEPVAEAPKEVADPKDEGKTPKGATSDATE